MSLLEWGRQGRKKRALVELRTRAFQHQMLCFQNPWHTMSCRILTDGRGVNPLPSKRGGKQGLKG